MAYLLGRLIEYTSAPSPDRDLIVLLMWPLVVIGSTVIVVVYLLQHPPPTPLQAPNSVAPTHAPVPPTHAPVPVRHTPAVVPDRQFVQLTPQYVGGLFKTHTSREAQHLLADFVGKWMEVSGTVRDVSEYTNFVLVSLVDEHRDDFGIPSIGLSFRGHWRDQVATFRRGDPVRAVGRINALDNLRIDLDPCEIPPASVQ